MELNEFVQNFAAQFEETDAALIKPETEFKGLEEWSSLLALCIIAMADEKYDVKLKGDDIRAAKIVEDLFNIIKRRKNEFSVN